MASLWKAIMNTWRKKRDDAAKALGDPVRDGKFAIEDAKKQESQFRSEVANLIAATKELERDQASATTQEQKWDRIARAAAAKFKGGDESAKLDVEAAAKEVERFRTRAAELTTQITKNRQVEQNLRTQMENVRTKISRAEQNHATLAARCKAAEIRKGLASAAAKIEEAGGGLGALDDLETAVNRTESEAEAFEELAVTSSSTLSDKYATAASGATSSLVDDYLK